MLILTALAWIAATANASAAADNSVIKLYVSPSGNDAWSGLLAEPNAGGTDGPLATVAKARDGVRGAGVPVTVVLRGGVYRLAAPLEFSPADSGTEKCPVIYKAYPGEKPVISGGVMIKGWEVDEGGKMWRAKLPAKEGDRGAWKFSQLFVNGQRRTRARTPNKGSFLRTDGPITKTENRGFRLVEGDVVEWANLGDVIFVVYHSWETSIHHVESVDKAGRKVWFEEPAPWQMGRWEKRQRFYVENVFEALDEPGEWYLNRATNTLHYYPLPGEKMEDIEAVAPVMPSTLVEFKGDASKGQTIEHLHFKGIAFRHTDSDLSDVKNPGQGEIYQPALIMASGLRHASFEDCEIAMTGAHAIWLGAGCEDNAIRRCHLHDLGGGGVYIGGGWKVNEEAPALRNTVDNNFIHDGSYLFHGAHGIWIGKSSHNKVTHNEISNFDYSGISCGWSWGFHPSSANHNHLDYNHIHHLGNGDGLSDMGGIYTLGVSPGTTERHNHMHHIYSYQHVSHGSGVYPDEGSSEILIENNVVHRVRTCPLFQHYGKDNLVRNNIFAFGSEGQLQRCRDDKPCHYIAEGNIVYAGIEQMIGGRWGNGDWKIGRNIYWSTAGAPRFLDMDFTAWKAHAKDEGSIVADPLFVDAEGGDFTLKPDSPALKLGFKPIDVSEAGLYGDKEWTELPKQFENRPLNEIDAPVEPPLVIDFDFEREEAGAEPLDGTTSKCTKPAGIFVSNERGAHGSERSLRFRDAPGQKFGWFPHLFYRPTFEEGEIELSWDMLNSREMPASFLIEVRDWDDDPYRTGPVVTVAKDGTVKAGNKKIGVIPAGEWASVAIRFRLGNDAPKTCRVQLDVPGREPVVAEAPFRSEAFEKVTWLGVTADDDADGCFYIDNLKLGTASKNE